MNLTIIVITFNEEFILPHFIKWYRDRFPNCKIVVYDNESTDGTKNICLSTPNLTYIPYYTGNKLSDSTYLKIKNNAWKHAETDWVIVCDVDEFLEVNQRNIEEFDNFEDRLVQGYGYNMCNVDNIDDVCLIRHGVRATQYDKTLLFNRKYIKEINYSAGCHSCEPHGDVNKAVISLPLYHMKFIDVDLLVNKYKSYASRLSDENKQMRWGYHYEQEEWRIREEFKNTLNIAKIIR
jgi:glycosyltransferase involved in cell wall biosynthesis